MVKIDVITGFLGAGKTTLLKKIIESPVLANERIVVIENEFGEIGIDGDLIRDEGFKLYEISKGCICCTLRQDFFATLIEIVDSVDVDRVIIEPSGIFIIDELMEILKAPELADKCTLNSIVTVIDGHHFLNSSIKFSMFFQSQISNATTLILSKLENVKEDVIKSIRTDLHKINQSAPIVSKEWNMLAIDDYNLLLAMDSAQESAPIDEHHHHKDDCSCCHGHHHEDYHDHHHHSHSQEYSLESFAVNLSKNYSMEAIEVLFERITGKEYGDIIRVKGFINVDNQIIEVNYVNGDLDIKNSTLNNKGKLIFIGTDLDKETLNTL